MNKTILPFLAAVILITGCDDPIFGNKVKIFNDKYQAPSISEGHYTQYGHVLNTTDATKILGLGYDITEAYLSNKALRSRVISLDKYTSLGDAFTISTISINQKDGRYIYGGNCEELVEALMKDSGYERSDFEGALYPYTDSFRDLPAYKDEYDHSSAYIFAAFCETHTSACATFDGSPPIINNLKQPELIYADFFKEELESGASPRDIIDLYGTHVIVTANLGHLRFDLFRAIPLKYDKDHTSDMLNTMLYWKNRIYKDNVTTDLTEAEKTADKHYFAETLGSRFNGGILADMPGSFSGMDSAGWYDSWKNDEYKSIVKMDKDCLIPIYDLISDNTLKLEMKEAVKEYMLEKQLKTCETLPVIQLTDGISYRYYTEIDYELQLTLEYLEGVGAANEVGVIGTIFAKNLPGTKPLYRTSNEYGDRLSNEELEGAEVIGYTYDDQGAAQVEFLYEISDGYHYAYTTKLQDKYSPEGKWGKTGKTIKIRRTI